MFVLLCILQLEELQKMHNQTLVTLTKDLYKAELELYDRYQDIVCFISSFNS